MVFSESAGRTGETTWSPTSTDTGIGSEVSFCMTTTSEPSGLRNATWFSYPA
jgi:hypothetical protein